MADRRPIELAQLDATILDLILGNPMPRGQKLLGIEYEQLILADADQRSAPLDFCRDLLRRLCERLRAEPIFEGAVMKGLRAREFEMSMEPGGQLEIACPPVARLAEAERVIESYYEAVAAELAGSGYGLVGIGHAPVTPVEEIGLLPRERYRIMDLRMPARGPLTRNMMRATAGFQLTYDVEDREDAARKLALLYRLTPVFVALTANSRRVAGKDSGWASFRHKVWLETDRVRSGVPDGCLHAETAIEGYVRYARRAAMLFVHSESGDGIVEAPDVSLEEHCAAGRITRADVDLHLSSLFPFVRLRNYLEVRCFDAIEWSFARSMLALVSGVVYCPVGAERAEALSDALVVDDRDALHALHVAAARAALEAHAPDGRQLREFARELLHIAAATLDGGSCDWARPQDLDEVRARLR